MAATLYGGSIAAKFWNGMTASLCAGW